MHQGVKRWHVPPLNAEVIGATSQASLSYLCQVTAREQSRQQWRWDHVSVIPWLRKVIETIYRNLDSLPVISIPHNKTLSPEDGSTLALGQKMMCCLHTLCLMCNVTWYFCWQLFSWWLFIVSRWTQGDHSVLEQRIIKRLRWCLCHSVRTENRSWIYISFTGEFGSCNMS